MRSGRIRRAIDDELALSDGALAFDVGRPRLEPDYVPLPQHEFGRILNRDDALLSEMNPDRMLSSVVLPAPVPPDTRMLSRPATAAFRNVSIGCVSDWLRTRSAAPSLSVLKRRIESTGTVNRERRNHGIDTRAVEQSGVDHRTGFVDAAPDGADDALDDPHQVTVVTKYGGDRFEDAVLFDVDLVEPIDEDVRHIGIDEQGLEWAQAEQLVQNVDDDRFALVQAERRLLRLPSRAARR
jgi:hypothetical protein